MKLLIELKGIRPLYVEDDEYELLHDEMCGLLSLSFFGYNVTCSNYRAVTTIRVTMGVDSTNKDQITIYITKQNVRNKILKHIVAYYSKAHSYGLIDNYYMVCRNDICDSNLQKTLKHHEVFKHIRENWIPLLK